MYGCEHNSVYGSGRFCNAKCARQFSSKKLVKKIKIVQCVTCGVNLEVDLRASAKVCKCDGCRSRKKYKQQDKKSPKQKVREKKLCLYCGTEVKNKFCNNSTCGREYKWSLKKQEIIKCNGVGPFSIRVIKRFIIEEYGHKCCMCGGTKWMGQPIPLIIDHINGRASDNRLENFRLVCGNCDMQLPTYKSKNKNSDRKRLGVYL